MNAYIYFKGVSLEKKIKRHKTQTNRKTFFIHCVSCSYIRILWSEADPGFLKGGGRGNGELI